MSSHDPSQPPADFNPFQAPDTTDVATEGLSDIEHIRREHISHESSVKAIGVLYVLGVLLNLVILVGAVAAINRGAQIDTARFILQIALILLLLPTSIGLIKLKYWARWTAVVFVIANTTLVISNIPVSGVPPIIIILVINVYILSLMLSRKANMVFSDEYKQIIKQTPHIKRKTSRILVGCLVILVTIVIVGVVVALVGGP